MKITKFTLAIIVISFLFTATFCFTLKIYFQAIDIIANPICPKTIYPEAKYYTPFEQIISEIGSRNYNREQYNCYDFSKDLIKELEKANIKSSIAISEKRDHAWVTVWIEATTGKFILPSEDLKILELRDKNLKVICN